MSKIYLAGDHAFFTLKSILADHVRALGHEVEDLGTDALNVGDDYPDFVALCTAKVSADPDSIGIVGGGSGQGEAMAANRTHGIRAALWYGGSLDIVRLAREHNDANVLSLGARFISEDEAKEAVRIFIGTPFSGEERHIRRLAKF